MKNKNSTLIWSQLNISSNYNFKAQELIKKQLLSKAAQMLSEGANVIDISFDTPHHQDHFKWEDQWFLLQNILPELRQLTQDQNAQICFSCSKYQTLEKALPYIDIFNDATALQNPQISDIVRQSKLPTVITRTAYEQNIDNTISAIAHIEKWMISKIKWVQNLKIDPAQLIFNPSVEIEKTYLESINIIQNITNLYKFNLPILIDHSRKGFIQELGARNLQELDFNTSVISMYLVDKGVEHIKVHDLNINQKMIAIAKQFRESWPNQQNLNAYFQRYIGQKN